MRTDSLISGVKRRKLFELVALHPAQALRVRELSRRLGVSPAFVSNYLSALERDGFLTREGKPRFSSPVLRALKALYNIQLLEPMAKSLSRHALVTGVGAYGSWISGTNTHESDVDIWVKVTRPLSLLEAAKLKQEAEGALNASVSLLIVYAEKLKTLKKENPAFYFALANSFVLWGEPVDLV